MTDTASAAAAPSPRTITVTDNSSGQSWELPVHEAIQREVESNPELCPEVLARDPAVQDIRMPADSRAQNAGVGL